MRKITCTQFVSKKALGEWFTSILISNYCYLFFLKCYHFALMKKGIWLFSFSFGLTSLPYLLPKRASLEVALISVMIVK